MSTQLRLVETTPPTTRVRAPKGRPVTARATRGRATSVRATGASRRAANWGEWRLDARTRRVGREGVAAARRALDNAQAAEPLSRAS